MGRKDEETALQAETRAIREKEERRNDVEAYIYNMRDKLKGELKDYVDAGVKAEFESQLEKAEDWLYDQDDSEMIVFVEKLTELSAIGDPIKKRKEEKSARAEWLPFVNDQISNYRLFAQRPDDKFDHIAKEKKDSIVEKCNEFENWLNDMSRKQSQLNDTQDPVLKAMDLKLRSESLQQYADGILSEPKPAPPPEEKKEDTKEADGDKMDVEEPEP